MARMHNKKLRNCDRDIFRFMKLPVAAQLCNLKFHDQMNPQYYKHQNIPKPIKPRTLLGSRCPCWILKTQPREFSANCHSWTRTNTWSSCGQQVEFTSQMKRFCCSMHWSPSSPSPKPIYLNPKSYCPQALLATLPILGH